MARLRVVIVGAGPCGVALARLLAQAGWTVTLVEAVAPEAPRPYRGEGLMPSGVAALEAMGLWPLPSGVRHRPLAGWAVVLERRLFFTVAEPLAGDRGCWLVDQASLLARLRRELVGLPGARVLEGVAVRGLVRADGTAGRAGTDGREASAGREMSGVDERRAPGAEREPGRVGGVVLADGRELAAELVVACDGRQSALRRLAGLELQGEGKGLVSLAREPSPAWRSAVAGGGQGEGAGRESVLWFRLAGVAVAPLERWLAGRFLTVVGEQVSFALFAEAGGEALRLGWVAEPGVALPADPAGWRERWAAVLPEEAAALMRALPQRAIEGPQRFPVQVGWAPRWHVPGLLLLGDAAHPMSPVRAQGINMALRDALVVGRLLGPLAGQPAAAPVVASAAAAAEGGSWGPGLAGGVDASRAPIDALLPQMAARRLAEIRRLQALQAREAGLGARLRQLGWLRRGLAATAPWSGGLARWRWIQQQHRLRQGLPEALALPE